MLIHRQIDKAARLMQQVGPDERDFDHPHFPEPLVPATTGEKLVDEIKRLVEVRQRRACGKERE